MKTWKKILLLIAAGLSLTACNKNKQDKPKEALIETESKQEEAKDKKETEDDTMTETNNNNSTLLNEETIGSNKYPQTSTIEGVSTQDLKEAMSGYYQENFSYDEKSLNYSQVPESVLSNIKTTLEGDERLSSFSFDVDQIKFELAGDTLFVARVVVLDSFENAEAKLTDNDYIILNQALAQLSGRLVTVVYYDENSNTLEPIHLANSQHSLFYNSQKAE